MIKIHKQKTKYHCFKIHKKNAWKTLENLETDPWNLGKPLWYIKNMVKLEQQHKQIDQVKSSNAEELQYFFNKIPKSSSQKHKNEIRYTWYVLMIKNVLLHDFCYCKQKSQWISNNTHNLQSSFDSMLIVFYSIAVFSVLFDPSFLI